MAKEFDDLGWKKAYDEGGIKELGEKVAEPVGLFFAFILLSTMGVMWNYWINLDLNRGWANGNFILLLGTGYMTLQYVMSLGLYTGERLWMKRMRHLRFLCFWTGVIFNVAYILSALSYVDQLDNWEGKELAGFDVILVMFEAFNLLLNWPTVVTNFGIILKEMSLEAQSNPRDPSYNARSAEVALHFDEIYESLEPFNPLGIIADWTMLFKRRTSKYTIRT